MRACDDNDDGGQTDENVTPPWSCGISFEKNCVQISKYITKKWDTKITVDTK